VGRRWLSGVEVAELLWVSSKTVARWAQRGLLPCGRTLGGHRRYDPQAIEQLRRRLLQPVTPNPSRSPALPVQTLRRRR
jgi:excisionase family DNA binding protein